MHPILGLVGLVFFAGFLGETEGLRCVDCSYREIIDPDSPNEEEAPKLFPNVYNFPFNDHPSCSLGETPNPLLSLDCSNERHISNIYFQTEYGKKWKQYQSPDDPNAEYKCVAVFTAHNESVNGTVKLIKSAFRACLEKKYDVKTAFKFIDGILETNITKSAIECDTDDCNGVGGDALISESKSSNNGLDGDIVISESKSSNLYNENVVILLGILITYFIF